MRTRSSLPSGQECSVRRRWHAIAVATASLARRKATKERVPLRVDLVAVVLGEGVTKNPAMVVEGVP
jgi:hypothetical protein